MNCKEKNSSENIKFPMMCYKGYKFDYRPNRTDTKRVTTPAVIK